MTLSVGDRVGPYEVLGLEGRGGVAEVYRARDTRLGRTVALKVLHQDRTVDARAVAGLTREARVLACISHPNIGEVHAVEEHGGTPVLVLEFVEGPTLADRLAAGRLDTDEALGIGGQIASALEAAHRHGVVHRDLKPSNVKLGRDGTVKVLDFGLANLTDPPTTAGDRDSSTVSAALDGITGTVAFMSPERLRGEPGDERADVWALGCTLYEMLTGRAAFRRATAAQTVAAVLTEPPDWSRLPDSLSPVVRAFLMRTLRPHPDERVRNAGDVKLALEGAFDPGLLVAAHGRPETRQRVSRGFLWRAIAAALIVIAAGLGLNSTGTREELATITFDIRAPEGSVFDQSRMQPYPALSPDGRRLAFIVVVGSLQTIAVQTVGGLDAVLLAGTGGATAPFWSADGNHLGFFASGTLKRVSVLGTQPVQTLCRCRPSPWGGFWKAPATIVFADGQGGLSQVWESDGEARPLTAIDESRGEYSHRWPVPVPDHDDLFVYLVRSSRPEARGLYLGSLSDRGLKRRLLPDDSNGTFGRDADGSLQLLFVRDGSLFGQRFDAVSARLAGEPRLIARHVVPGETGRFAPFTALGRTLVFRPATPARTRLVWKDRRGVALAPVGPVPADYGYLSLSPDGTRVAVSRVEENTGRLDVWLMDAARPSGERLTQDPVGAIHPTWTPDGRRVVYASAAEGSWNLHAISPARPDQIDVLYRSPDPILKYPDDVTSDGRYLVYHSTRHLMRLPLGDEGPPVALIPAGFDGRVSPDGRWLAYTSRSAENLQIYVTTFPEPTERWRISATFGRDAQWRADGRELYYIGEQGTLMAVPVRRSASFEPGHPTPLFRSDWTQRGRTQGRSYAPALDGSRFLVVEDLRGHDITLRVTINWVGHAPPAAGGPQR